MTQKKSKNWLGTTVLIIALVGVSGVCMAQGESPIGAILNPSADTVKELTLFHKLAKIAMGALFWILSPVTGAFFIYQGLTEMKRAPRGESWDGIKTLALGVLVASIGPVLSQIFKQIGG